MMRIMSVLANPNNINVLVSGDLVSAFNIMETSVPATVVDAVIHLFCKIQNSASQSKWLIEPIFRFLASKCRRLNNFASPKNVLCKSCFSKKKTHKCWH